MKKRILKRKKDFRTRCVGGVGTEETSMQVTQRGHAGGTGGVGLHGMPLRHRCPEQ